MTVYLYPNMKSKKAYKEALKEGKRITALEHTPFGARSIHDETVTFSGPHFPQAHKFYGQAVVKDGIVIKIS